MRKVMWLGLLGSVAHAGDVQMQFQGRALDAQGQGANGSMPVSVALFTTLGGGTSVWSDTFNDVDVSDGYFTVLLGSEDALDSSLLDQSLFVDVAVNSVSLTPRQQLTAVPMAAVSQTLADGIVTDVLGHREWSDGTYATSCEGYLRSPDHHQYAGDTGNGTYRIDPDGGGVGTAFDVYCDMSTDGGGWTLLLKTNGDTTLGYNASEWTSVGTLNPTDTTPSSANAKYRSFDELNISEMRGCFVADDFCFSMPLGGRTALTVFSGATYMVGFDYRANPDWRIQPYCRMFGINTSYSYRQVRFGFTANNENDCSSNDTGVGFGTRSSHGTASEHHGAAEMCLSSSCTKIDGSGGDTTVHSNEHGMLWGR